ncbi:MAG: TetR/AcrR family transcriptional regulator [Methylobacteriaceae bacterium]|nr:TetR/AcrR family transcriptional regulator [Methylobacteriaceae bacterium]
MTDAGHESRTKLLDAALNVVRARGYTATRVEDICSAARLTKGSFFHHFKTKEELALAAAERWGAVTGALFAAAPYRQLSDPLERLLAYVDLRKALIRGELAEFTCFAGTTTQEVHQTHPAIRDACGATIRQHAGTLEADIAAAMRQYGVGASWTVESLALHTQAVIQGAFVLAKATQDPAIAIASLDHLRRYLELLFRSPQAQEERT